MWNRVDLWINTIIIKIHLSCVWLRGLNRTSSCSHIRIQLSNQRKSNLKKKNNRKRWVCLIPLLSRAVLSAASQRPRSDQDPGAHATRKPLNANDTRNHGIFTRHNYISKRYLYTCTGGVRVCLMQRQLLLSARIRIDTCTRGERPAHGYMAQRTYTTLDKP